MHVTMRRTAMPLLLVLTLGALSFAGEPSGPQTSSAPSIAGTYQLSSRQLPDGTVLTPPDIRGLQTYTKSYRNFNLLSKDAEGTFTSLSIVSTYTLTPTEYTEDAEGTFTSLSIVSTYTLTPTEYTETPLFSISVRGQEIRHDLSGQTQRAAVTVDAGRLQFQRPVEQPVSGLRGEPDHLDQRA